MVVPLLVTAFARVESFCQRHFGWLVLACVLLGFVLRLQGLETYWLNPDEGTYLDAAAAPTWAELGGKIAPQPHPPLFHLVLRPIALFSADIGLLRLPSLVFGCLAVLGISLLTRVGAGGFAGLVAGLLTAVAPGAILLSQLVRPYSLQLFTLSFGIWFLLRYLERKRRADLLGFSLGMGLALSSHYSSALILLAADVLVLGLLLGRRLPWSQIKLLGLAHLPLAAVLLGAYFLHLRSGVLAQSLGVPHWLEPFVHDSAGDLWLGWIDLQRYLFGSGYGALSLLLVILGFVAAARSRRGPLAAFAAIALVIAAVASLLELYPFGNARHASYLAIVVIPMLAQGVVSLLGGRGVWQVVGTLALALMLVFPGVVDRALGSPRVAPDQLEQVTTASAIEDLDPLFRKIQSRPGILVIDKQTWFALLPLFGRVDASSHGGRHPSCPLDDEAAGIEHFHWGTTRVLVNRAWQMRGSARQPDDFDHVVGFLQRADAAYPSLALGERHDGWIFLGGGRHQLDHLVALDRSGASRLRFLSGIRRLPGFGIARIDPSRLLRRFSAPSDASRGARRSARP